MEIVLGVAMTPTAVSIALVEGEKADGVIVERDVFDITAIDGSATSSACDHVIAAVLGTQEGAVDAGHHLVSTGVAWSDHAAAAALREAVVARGIEDVLLVSELHAAAALAQAVGRAVGYDKTALMFVERDTATLAVVETVDGSVVKVLSRSLHGGDTVAVFTEMVTSLEHQESAAQGLFVVGSGVDVTAVKAQLAGLVSVPVIVPEEPRLALARGAALASANAPRYDASTAGLAYSQDPDDGTTVSPLALAGDVTTYLGDADSSADTADIVSDPDDVPERRKRSLLMGSSLTAIFVAGMMALTIAMVVRAPPAVDQGLDDTMMLPDAAAPPTALQSAPPAASPPTTIPTPAPAAPPRAAAATARRKIPSAPPPPVLVHNAAPAPAAPPAPPPPVGPPPVVLAPGIPPLVIQWLPPILQPPPFFNPGPKGPGGRGGGGHGGGGHGGGRHGGHGGD